MGVGNHNAPSAVPKSDSDSGCMLVVRDRVPGKVTNKNRLASHGDFLLVDDLYLGEWQELHRRSDSKTTYCKPSVVECNGRERTILPLSEAALEASCGLPGICMREGIGHSKRGKEAFRASRWSRRQKRVHLQHKKLM